MLKYDEGARIWHAFDSVPLNLENTSNLHVAGNQTYSPRVKHVVLRYFFVQKLARREGQISIHYVKTEYQLADIEVNTRVSTGTATS